MQTSTSNYTNIKYSPWIKTVAERLRDVSVTPRGPTACTDTVAKRLRPTGAAAARGMIHR